jgi:hypothetical protein
LENHVRIAVIGGGPGGLDAQSIDIDGVGFSSIGRLDLLTILQQRVRVAGPVLRYGDYGLADANSVATMNAKGR